jgi:COP9 signalosome complex subunit 7
MCIRSQRTTRRGMEDANGSRASTSTMMTTIEPAVEAVRRGEAVEEAVRDALEAPGIVHYGRLLAAMRETRGAEEGEKKVEMFAYGTYGDYVRGLREGKMKELTTGEALKLRRLTACGLCAGASTKIPYERMMRALDIADVSEFEEFMVDECLSTGILRGKLDPKNKLFAPRGGATRDVPESALDALIADVSRWHDVAEAMLVSLKDQYEYVMSEKAKSVAKKDEIDAAVEEMKAQLMKATEVEASLQPDAEATEMDECPSAGVKRRR